MTRAKKELYLSFCQKRFNGYEQVEYPPSRFLENLNFDLLNPINFHLNDIFSSSNIFHYKIGENEVIDIKQDFILKHNDFLLNSFEEEQPKIIKNNHTNYIVGDWYKYKDDVGELLFIEENDFNEVILNLEINGNLVKVLPEYENIIKFEKSC